MNFKNSEGFKRYVSQLSDADIQSMSNSNWLSLYKKIEDADVNIENNWQEFVKLYENYRIPLNDSKNIKILAAKCAYQFVSQNKTYEKNLITFNALPENKRLTILNRMSRSIYSTVFEGYNKSFYLTPRLEYIPNNYFAGYGQYESEGHLISLVKANRKEHLGTMVHELAHSLERDSEKSIDYAKNNSPNNFDMQELFEYNSMYYFNAGKKDDGIWHQQAYAQQPMEARARLFEISFLRSMFKHVSHSKVHFDYCYKSLYRMIKHSDLKALEPKINLHKNNLIIVIPQEKINDKALQIVDNMKKFLCCDKIENLEVQLNLFLPEADKSLSDKMSTCYKEFLASPFFKGGIKTVPMRVGHPAKIMQRVLMR